MHALFMEGEAHDRVHRICGELGLSPPLLKAFVHLGTLDGDGGLRMSDLAETWGCDASVRHHPRRRPAGARARRAPPPPHRPAGEDDRADAGRPGQARARARAAVGAAVGVRVAQRHRAASAARPAPRSSIAADPELARKTHRPPDRVRAARSGRVCDDAGQNGGFMRTSRATSASAQRSVASPGFSNQIVRTDARRRASPA